MPLGRRFGLALAVLLVVSFVLSLGERELPVTSVLLGDGGCAGLQAFAAILFFTWRPLF